jgi:hypothetical protein
MIKMFYIPGLIRKPLALAFVLAVAHGTFAQEMKVEARLIWGANAEFADKTKVDPRLNEDLSRIFKWKTYYQITNCVATLPVNETRSYEMSSQCVLTIKNLGDSKFEVSCVGNGKPVWKGAYPLQPGKWLTLAGPDRNDTAWFIVMRSTDVKKP